MFEGEREVELSPRIQDTESAMLPNQINLFREMKNYRLSSGEFTGRWWPTTYAHLCGGADFNMSVEILYDKVEFWPPG
jgi:hypothetical protein